VRRVIAERRTVTPDLGGTAGTRAMTDAIVAALKAA
jgi:isocitrate/isopropylmalate dehydrogenase